MIDLIIFFLLSITATHVAQAAEKPITLFKQEFLSIQETINITATNLANEITFQLNNAIVYDKKFIKNNSIPSDTAENNQLQKSHALFTSFENLKNYCTNKDGTYQQKAQMFCASYQHLLWLLNITPYQKNIIPYHRAFLPLFEGIINPCLNISKPNNTKNFWQNLKNSATHTHRTLNNILNNIGLITYYKNKLFDELLASEYKENILQTNLSTINNFIQTTKNKINQVPSMLQKTSTVFFNISTTLYNLTDFKAVNQEPETVKNKMPLIMQKWNVPQLIDTIDVMPLNVINGVINIYNGATKTCKTLAQVIEFTKNPLQPFTQEAIEKIQTIQGHLERLKEKQLQLGDIDPENVKKIVKKIPTIFAVAKEPLIWKVARYILLFIPHRFITKFKRLENAQERAFYQNPEAALVQFNKKEQSLETLIEISNEILKSTGNIHPAIAFVILTQNKIFDNILPQLIAQTTITVHEKTKKKLFDFINYFTQLKEKLSQLQNKSDITKTIKALSQKEILPIVKKSNILEKKEFRKSLYKPFLPVTTFLQLTTIPPQEVPNMYEIASGEIILDLKQLLNKKVGVFKIEETDSDGETFYEVNLSPDEYNLLERQKRHTEQLNKYIEQAQKKNYLKKVKNILSFLPEQDKHNLVAYANTNAYKDLLYLASLKNIKRLTKALFCNLDNMTTEQIQEKKIIERSLPGTQDLKQQISKIESEIQRLIILKNDSMESAKAAQDFLDKHEPLMKIYKTAIDVHNSGIQKITAYLLSWLTHFITALTSATTLDRLTNLSWCHRFVAEQLYKKYTDENQTPYIGAQKAVFERRKVIKTLLKLSKRKQLLTTSYTALKNYRKDLKQQIDQLWGLL